ncbi:hypothetical protein [Streptomyces bambusae]|nr:hypothetical protein [Streptomyces bambusae]
MPIYLRAGDGPEAEIGYIAAFLRAAADAYENPPAEEVPDAPA